MDHQLDGNLPLSEQQKPIMGKNKIGRVQKAILALKNQESDGSEETQDEEYKYVIATKRIRYLNPMRFYVTFDVSSFF